MKKGIYPYNDKGQRHGQWERYSFGGDVIYKCLYKNGTLIGYDEHFFYYYKNIEITFHL